VFDGANILLKMHAGGIYTLQDYCDFYIRSVWLEIASSRPFWGVLGDIKQMHSDIVATPKRTVLGH